MRTKYIVKKIDEGKKLAIWYYGQGAIAEIIHLNRKIVIKVSDYIRIVDESGKCLQKSKAFNALKTLVFSNDTDLYNHNDKYFHDYFGNFDFVYVNLLNGAEEILGNDEVPTYTEAIKYAHSIIKDNKFWIDTDKQINKVTTIGANENWLKYVIYEETFVPPTRER